MTAREDLRAALLRSMPDDAPEADRLINAAIAEAVETRDDVLHFFGRPAPGELGYARDQLIVAFRGGEEDEFCRYGWDEAVLMADRVVAAMRVEVARDLAARQRQLERVDPECGTDALIALIDPEKQES